MNGRIFFSKLTHDLFYRALGNPQAQAFLSWSFFGHDQVAGCSATAESPMYLVATFGRFDIGLFLIPARQPTMGFHAAATWSYFYRTLPH